MNGSSRIEISWSAKTPLTVAAYRDFFSFLNSLTHTIVRISSTETSVFFTLQANPLDDGMRAEWDQRSFAQGYRMEWQSQETPRLRFSRAGVRITGLATEIRATDLARCLEFFDPTSPLRIHLEPRYQLSWVQLQVDEDSSRNPPIREALLKIREEHPEQEWNLLPAQWIPEDLRIAAFDLDSTLIEQEGLDELAREHGCYEPVAQVTEAAMRGELDFAASFTRRVSYLQGMNRSAVERVYQRIQLTPGAPEFLEFLTRHGIKSAIFSGGFDFFAEPVATQLGIDHVVCNRLEWKNEQATGAPRLPIVDAARKAQALIEMREKNTLIPGDTLAVGDGANDIPMLREAGVGVAFHAKPKVKQAASVALDRRDLRLLIPLLGFVQD